MNYFDLIILVALLWSAYKGFSKGFIHSIASFAALLLGIYGAIKFSDVTSHYLIQNFHFNPNYLPIISFAVTFVIIVVAVHFAATLIDKLIKAIALGFINRILGAVFGIAKIAFIISIILVIVNGLDKNLKFLSPQLKQNSFLYKPLSNFAPSIFPYLKFENIGLNKSSTNKTFVFSDYKQEGV
ncbi:MAG: CvpA family protein [Bacteroidales bacterium]|nr:CvpA family protein [Bacteroidales bacterium]